MEVSYTPTCINLEAQVGVLTEFDHKSHTILLDGEFRRSEATESRAVIDPATEIVIAEIAETTAAEIDAAVDAGQAAYRKWWRISALERSEIMHEIAIDLLAMKPQLAEALTREMGKPYKESADEVDWSVSAIRYYAETGRTDIGRVMGPAVEGHLNYTLKLPLGVVVSIQPFNYPMTLLAWEGAAALVISDIHERRLGEAADKIEAETGVRPETTLCNVTKEDQVQAMFETGVRPETTLCNVTKEDQVQAMFELAIDKMGHVDVLMNNAGLGGYAKLVDMTDDQWSLVLDVTLNGCFRCTRAALKHMMPRGKGAIVNNASVLGWRAQEGQSHYAAAKAGVMALTRCAAIEAAERNVRINCVSPSLAMHPFLEKVTPPGLLEELQKREAFGRGAEPWEISNVMVFLASDYSSYMTGEVLSVSSQRA